MRKYLVFLPVLLILVGLVGYFVVISLPGDPAMPGDKAPDFELKSMTGENIALSDYKGEPVLLIFWSIYCSDCAEELQVIQEIYEEYGNSLVIIGVNIDNQPEYVAQFVDDFGLTFTILLDSEGGVYYDYNILYTPTRLFIDKDGSIIVRKSLSLDSKEDILLDIDRITG